MAAPQGESAPWSASALVQSAFVHSEPVPCEIAHTARVTSERGPRVVWQASLFDTEADTGGAPDADRFSFATLRPGQAAASVR